MRYRTKLYLAMVTLAIVSTTLALGMVYAEVKSFLFKEVQSKVISIVATVASSIDGDELKQIKGPADESTEAYKKIQTILRRARDANRRDDLFVKFLYTDIPNPQDPKKFVYGVDAEENESEDFSRYGDPDIEASNNRLFDYLDEPFASDSFEEDPFGIWLSAYAPVFDSQGNYVASVGLDTSAAEVIAKLNELLLLEIPAFLAAIVLAVVAATILSQRASFSLGAIYNVVKLIEKGNFDNQVHLTTHDEFAEVAEAINRMEKGLKERERLKTSFARYVSRHVFEQILHSDTPTKLEGERRKVTILFSDIRNFTRLAEELSPEAVVSILNEYFEEMLESIFSHQGMIDKFIGDGIMAEFGAPLDDPYQEKNAVLAAIDMQKRLKTLSQRWAREGKPTLEMGIGIHTGQAVLGNIGSEQRMEYTAIGDAVNVASRLEHASKQLNAAILISDATFKELKGEFPAKNCGSLTLPGRSKEVIAYSIDMNS